jgi:pilus assembly protein CpaE
MATTPPVHGVALVASPALQAAVSEAASTVPGLKMHVELVQPEAILARATAHGDEAHLLLVDFRAGATTVDGDLAELSARRGLDCPTLVSAEGLDLDGVRRLHRLGVFDALPQPAVVDDVRETLAAAVRHVRARRRQNGGLAPVVAFTRAKGGMGATTLATHAMLSLAGNGRRKAPARNVAFIDFDIQFGDASINLDVTPSSVLLDLLQTPTRLDGAVLRSSMVDRPEGFAMLPAPRDLLPFEALEPETAGRLIDVAREEFDVVVLDLPLAITSWTHAVLERVNQLVIVTALSVCGIRRSRRLLELLEQEEIGAIDIALALNRFSNRLGERNIVRQSEKTLGRPFDFRIANDYQLVARSQDQGLSLFSLKPRSRLARDIHQLADTCFTTAVRKIAEAAREPSLPLAAE